MKQKNSIHKNIHILRVLFITWFLYSFGMLGYIAFNDRTQSHCLITDNLYVKN